MKILQYTLPLFVSLSLCATEVYTVDKLLIQALENSPDLKVHAANYKASQSRIGIAQSSYLPKVDLQVSMGKNARTNVPTDNLVSDELLLGKLSLKQLLYDFDKTTSNIKSVSNDSYALDKVNEQKISDKIRDVKFSYYAVLQTIALIDVHEENVKLNASQLYRAERYFEAGIRTKIDISDAQVELIKAKLDLKNAQYDLKLAYASLDKVVGFKDTHTDYTVYSKELKLDNLFSTLSDYPLKLNDSVLFAYENKNELKQYMFQIKSAEAKSTLASSDYYPELYFGANYTKQELKNFKDILPEDQWQAAINLDWNLYQGGATNALSQEKRIEIDKAHAELNDIKLSIKETTTQAYINVYKAKDIVELSQSLLKVSDEKFIQAGKRYENGLSDFIELQQSRQGYIDAKASLVVSYYNYYQAIAYLDNAIGK